MDVTVYNSFETLPSYFDNLLASCAQSSPYLGRAWFDVVANTAIKAGWRTRLYGITRDRRGRDPVCLFPAIERKTSSTLTLNRPLESLTSLYTIDYDLLLSPGIDINQTVSALALFIDTERPRWSSMHIKALVGDSVDTSALQNILREFGWITQKYYHFGNWYRPTPRMSFEMFRRELPKGLRQLWNKMRRPGLFEFRLITAPNDVQEGLAIYNQIYSSSWKEPEPFPKFIPELMKECANLGSLRLGILSVEGELAAVQFWIVSFRRATIFKVAHVEKFRRLSVGSTLTLCVLKHALDVDQVEEIDFGRGDEPYKKMWLPFKRERLGIFAFNPQTTVGLVGACRHILGHQVAEQIRHAKKLVRGPKNEPAPVSSAAG